MQKNVSKLDDVKASLMLPINQLKGVTSILTNRKLASKLSAASEIRLGSLRITKKEEKEGKGLVKFNYKGRNLSFHYDSKERLAETLGMIMDEFIKGESSKINVKGRNVVDVGAYVADTAICYVANDARHVYAFEPFPYFYRIGQMNIKANNMSKKITMVNAGCGGGSSKAEIDRSSKRFTRVTAQKKKGGKSNHIRIMSLEQVANVYKLKDAILKIDCEGCEYEIILKASRDVLRRFSEIQVEYHYGYKNIEERLREMGFDVKITKPTKKYNFATSSIMTVGFINARIRRGKNG